MQKKKGIVKKLAGPSRAITSAVGGRKFAQYVGEAVAKKKNPNVKRTVKRGDAYKSAANLALGIATAGSVGAAGAAISKGRAAAKAVKYGVKPPTSFKIPGQIKKINVKNPMGGVQRARRFK